MASIKMDNLHKVYTGGVRAVTGINLDIADGEMIVLVGPSGCGKSTLLRMVAGLETISEGTLKIGDRVVNTLEPADRDIAMVFQNYALYPHMTVFNNLAYGLKNRGFSKTEIDRRVRQAAEMLEIGQFLDRKPRQLSGGNASVSPWAAHWCANRRRSCSTNRCRTWMRNCVCKCGWKSGNCKNVWPPHRCM